MLKKTPKDIKIPFHISGQTTTSVIFNIYLTLT